MNTLTDTLVYFLILVAELSVLFLGISAIVAFALLHVPREKLSSWLTKRGLLGNALGALVGALTPFCACSTIPMTQGMLSSGAPFGPVMSFLIASPLLNPIILTMIATMLGIEASLVYFAITFTGAVVFGVVLEKAGFSRQLRPARTEHRCCGSARQAPPATFRAKLAHSLTRAWRDFRPVIPFMLVGVALGAGIYGFVPQELVARLAGEGNPLAIPVAAVIGIPLYIRAETAIPIGLALSEKGMSVGAVIALIIGGAGMAIPEMSMMASLFRRRLVVAMVATIFMTAVVGGVAFDALF